MHDKKRKKVSKSSSDIFSCLQWNRIFSQMTVQLSQSIWIIKKIYYVAHRVLSHFPYFQSRKHRWYCKINHNLYLSTYAIYLLIKKSRRGNPKSLDITTACSLDKVQWYFGDDRLNESTVGFPFPLPFWPWENATVSLELPSTNLGIDVFCGICERFLSRAGVGSESINRKRPKVVSWIRLAKNGTDPCW